MKESPAVAGRLLHFYDRLTAGDVAAFDDLVSAEPGTCIVGTAPGEFVTERDRLRFGFETEGVGLEAGRHPTAWEEGAVGWAFDEPVFKMPDGSQFRVRLTAIFRDEDGAWRLVHGHFSSGVPDEDVVQLQQGWGIAP